MGTCGSCETGGGGPFSEGRELVEFVVGAHGGAIKDLPISSGALETVCQGCGETFKLETHVGTCPKCGDVHAVSPPRSGDATNIQFAGTDYKLPEDE